MSIKRIIKIFGKFVSLDLWISICSVGEDYIILVCVWEFVGKCIIFKNWKILKSRFSLKLVFFLDYFIYIIDFFEFFKNWIKFYEFIK